MNIHSGRQLAVTSSRVDSISSTNSSQQQFGSTRDFMEQPLSPIDDGYQTTPEPYDGANIVGYGSKGQLAPLLSWDNVTYSVRVKDKEQSTMRTLLHGISGEVYPGEVIGLLGPSGAGKTTLLNILAGRIEGGVLNGKVQFRGKKRVPGIFKRRVAYVEQEDV
ncbi:hypothetical protein GGH92_009664, partial [Coemansia sp. RSA 2673]